MSRPSLVVFGSQADLPTPENLYQLRAILLLQPRLRIFLNAIKELPDLWRILVASDARLAELPGEELLGTFNRWLEDGQFPTMPPVIPNVVCTPLTVIIHIIQYFSYLVETEATNSQILSYAHAGGVQGFCTGILAAVATACSESEADLLKYAAVALRLAVCIGAYVDLDTLHGELSARVSCLAVRWNTAASREDVLQILNQHEGGYISVITDTNSATITIPISSATILAQQLAAEGFMVKPIALTGRFHSKVHEEACKKISDLCASNTSLQFPSAERLLVSLRSNATSEVIAEGSLHTVAVECLLVEPADWRLTISAATSELSRFQDPTVLQVGFVECIPSSIVREHGLKVSRLSSSKHLSVFPIQPVSKAASGHAALQESHYPDHAVAIVGMACKVPGADSVEDFWDLIISGTSMVSTVPPERFPIHDLRRSPGDKLKFWGNFVNDADAFDHHLFKRTAREAASMDPQQRLLLEAAYAAMESSGYFGDLSITPEPDIGCYIGACGSDYTDNIASHMPNAFSTLGALRAYLAGRISHYFGWTGPSITYDTACSSSAVAIHAACKAIQDGECSRAIAGGVSLYTSPNMFQNHTGASFLSPTGQTKPFDSTGDGFCRGEGVGLVVLKKLSDAVAHGDSILAVITGSAVNQTTNDTPITVPNSRSQVKLYGQVTSIAGVDPKDVSYVEAHGTGTPVGDPVEFESIRKAFGGSTRSETLRVASVKGNIGHLEGASGAAALIKTVLMLHHKEIPLQASHSNLNPKIGPLEPSRMEIPSSNLDWDTKFRIACVNNYGASGSNAAMIICPGPLDQMTLHENAGKVVSGALGKYPIYISANTENSLKSYCAALQRSLPQLVSGVPQHRRLSHIAFHLADRQNRALPYVLSTSVESIPDLEDLLREGALGESQFQHHISTRKRQPMILVFGGQTKDFIGLSREIYDSVALLRSHLDHCDSLVKSAGLSSIYSSIFSTEPVHDMVGLHCSLFALQYSCAKAWIDAGLHVDALVGHSFGQLTALCVSGSLSLEDGIKLIAGRAQIMQKDWGVEKGCMISLQADTKTVLTIIASVKALDTNLSVEVACYNGPRSHVLVGTKSAIDSVEHLIVGAESPFGLVKFKRLKVTHGFHSKLTEPLIPSLLQLAGELDFSLPDIPLETCSSEASWTIGDARLIAEHTRTPVYFGNAIERLVARFNSCTWLEAGSGSSVTGMVRSALRDSSGSTELSHIFQPIQLDGPDAMDSLVDSTINLWRAGYKVQFWAFHRSQKHLYTHMNLPPYQFEKNRHWLEWKDTVETPVILTPTTKDEEEIEPPLLSLIEFSDPDRCSAVFSINVRSEEYEFYVHGHAVLGQPLCAAPIYMELASQAATMIASTSDLSSSIPSVENLEIKMPLGGSDRKVSILLTRTDGIALAWRFAFTSRPLTGAGTDAHQEHATGTVILQPKSLPIYGDFSRYEGLVGYHRIDNLMVDSHAEHIGGSLIYTVFKKVITYADYYRGVRRISGNSEEAAALVQLPQGTIRHQATILHPLLIDNFIQVAAIHTNCLSSCAESEVYVCAKVEKILARPEFTQADVTNSSFAVYSKSHRISETEVASDVYIFDADKKCLVLLILGARFSKVLIASLAKVLSSANNAQKSGFMTYSTLPESSITLVPAQVPAPTFNSAPRVTAKPVRDFDTDNTTMDIGQSVRELLHKVTDVSLHDIKDETSLADLGVDSLISMEVVGELKMVFGVKISQEELQSISDVKSLCHYLLSNGAGGGFRSSSESDTESEGPNMIPSPADTTATSVDGAPIELEGITSRLSKLVGHHLETTVAFTRDTNLADYGMDSLLSIELGGDIQEMFGVRVDMSQIGGESTFGDLLDMVTGQHPVTARGISLTTSITDYAFPSLPAMIPSVDADLLPHFQKSFEKIRYKYDDYAKQTGCSDFWRQVYPAQARLTLSYVVEAFNSMGCALDGLNAGDKLPTIHYLPKHSPLVAQLYRILEDAGLVLSDGEDLIRSDVKIDPTPSKKILSDLLLSYPQYASDHKLAHTTGSKLADCLTGAADPLGILFRTAENRTVLEDFYKNSAMYKAAIKILGNFMADAFANPPPDGKFHLLEIGGGTGGTTKFIVDFLVSQGVSFTYTFTDLSASLVATAKKTLASRPCMSFQVLNIEKTPPPNLLNKFHAVISTNCIHATKNLQKSTSHIRQMLRPEGFLSLIEFTRNIYWFDLVFGLLDGWWLFEDGRKHVLADETFWDSSLRSAGFKHVAWTDGESQEAQTKRVITAFAGSS